MVMEGLQVWFLCILTSPLRNAPCHETQQVLSLTHLGIWLSPYCLQRRFLRCKSHDECSPHTVLQRMKGLL